MLFRSFAERSTRNASSLIIWVGDLERRFIIVGVLERERERGGERGGRVEGGEDGRLLWGLSKENGKRADYGGVVERGRSG